MKLILGRRQFYRIKKYLTRDHYEAMVLGLCQRRFFSQYRVVELLFPAKTDYLTRSPSTVTLKAESAYGLLRRLKADPTLSFLQVHRHPDNFRMGFSAIDDLHNPLNATDIREFNSQAQFFRMLICNNQIMLQYFDFDNQQFKDMEIKFR